MQSYPDEFNGDIIPIALNQQGFSTACQLTKRRLPSSSVLIIVPSGIQFLWPVSWRGKITIPIHREQSCPHA
jgi:hypothetical protein